MITVKQQRTSKATSLLTTTSTYRSLSAQRLSERTVYVAHASMHVCIDAQFSSDKRRQVF
jgi:uncharacterized protein YcbK (DUF882 family)